MTEFQLVGRCSDRMGQNLVTQANAEDALMKMDFPTYPADNLPDELAAIDPVKPGS